MKVKDLVVGMIATFIGVIAFGILVKMAWQFWDALIQILNEMGYPPGTEYLLGFMLLLASVWLGIIQLKKPGRGA